MKTARYMKTDVRMIILDVLLTLNVIITCQEQEIVIHNVNLQDADQALKSVIILIMIVMGK